MNNAYQNGSRFIAQGLPIQNHTTKLIVPQAEEIIYYPVIHNKLVMTGYQ
jgi:hypothetical protein